SHLLSLSPLHCYNRNHTPVQFFHGVDAVCVLLAVGPGTSVNNAARPASSGLDAAPPVKGGTLSSKRSCLSRRPGRAMRRRRGSAPYPSPKLKARKSRALP